MTTKFCQTLCLQDHLTWKGTLINGLKFLEVKVLTERNTHKASFCLNICNNFNIL